MKTITITVEMEDSQIECLKRISNHCAYILDDLLHLLGNEDGNSRIKISTRTNILKEPSKGNSSTGQSDETAIDKREDLKPEYMFAADAAEYLRTTTKKIALFRQNNLVKYSKFGKNFVYKKSWLDTFSEEWAGYDLSNEERIRHSISEKAWRETHDIGKPKKSKIR